MKYSDILIHAVQRMQGASDGRWAAIEVKIGEDKVEDAIKTLNHLEEKVCSNPRAKVRPPEFKMLLVGVFEYARKAGDRLYIMPVRLLGP